MQDEQPIRLLAIQSKNEKSGFHLAWVPAELNDDQIAAALAELEIEPEQGIEIGDWKTSSQNVMTAFIPFPSPFQGAEPTRS